MAILQLIAEKEKSLCFDFLEEKIRTVKDKDGKVLLDENGNAIVKTVTGPPELSVTVFLTQAISASLVLPFLGKTAVLSKFLVITSMFTI